MFRINLRHLRAVAALLALVVVVLPVAAQGYQVRQWPVGQPVPELVTRDLAGHPWDLRDLKGRAVLINFWASWCEPCLAEMPSLQALARQWGPDKLLVLAVNFKQSRPAMDLFVQKTAFQLPVLPDPQGLIARQWGIKVFPTTVLVAANGSVRALVQGELDWQGLPAQAMVQTLLP